MKKLFTITALFLTALLASCGSGKVEPSPSSSSATPITPSSSISPTTSSSSASPSTSSQAPSSTSKSTDVKVTGITLAAEQATVKEKKEYTILATISPLNATNMNVIWTSSDESVATVRKDTDYLEILNVRGIINTLKPGTTTITATTEDGGFSATCVLTVKELVHVTGVTLSAESLKLEKDATKKLYAYLEPSNPENDKVSWTSSDESIATVSDTGLVTAISAGEATITVTTEDGGFTAECKVTVLPPVVATYELGETKLDLLDGSFKDYYRISTPIKNTGNVNLYVKSVSYDVETTDGTPVDSISQYHVDTFPDIIEPGETVLAYVFYSYDHDYSADELVAKPTVVIKNAMKYDSERLTVSNVTLSMDKYSGPKVTGKVKNTLGEDIDDYYVTANIYDSDGNFVLGGFTTNTEGLAADGERVFSFTSLDGFLVKDLDINTLRVEVVAYKYQLVIII